MRISTLKARLEELLADCGDVEIGIVDRNVQGVIEIDKIEYVPEDGQAMIFADDEP